MYYKSVNVLFSYIDLFLQDHKFFSQYPHNENQFIALLGKLSPFLRMRL